VFANLFQSSSILSLHEIHQATRISKPSLLRILNTLEHVGFVSRRLADGHYRISAFARMGRKRDRYDRVAEAAAPVLDRLCQKVSWPSDLMVPAGDHMEIRETSRIRTGCARAASGHAPAPPSSVMNSRRRMSNMGRTPTLREYALSRQASPWADLNCPEST
jgi:DNA-binding IclR family transcriptional regulator